MRLNRLYKRAKIRLKPENCKPKAKPNVYKLNINFRLTPVELPGVEGEIQYFGVWLQKHAKLNCGLNDKT